MPEADDASLETLLGRLGLKKHLPTFVEEELDVALLKSMGVHLKQSVVGLGLSSVEADRLVAAVNGDESVFVGDELLLEENDNDDDDDGLVMEENAGLPPAKPAAPAPAPKPPAPKPTGLTANMKKGFLSGGSISPPAPAPAPAPPPPKPAVATSSNHGRFSAVSEPNPCVNALIAAFRRLESSEPSPAANELVRLESDPQTAARLKPGGPVKIKHDVNLIAHTIRK